MPLLQYEQYGANVEFCKGFTNASTYAFRCIRRSMIITLTEPQVKKVINKINMNEYNFVNGRGLKNVETNNRSHSDLALEGYEDLLTKFEVLIQKLNVASKTQ